MAVTNSEYADVALAMLDDCTAHKKAASDALGAAAANLFMGNPNAATAFDKQSDRHTYAEQSIYKQTAAPAVTKYDTSVKPNTSTMVNIESGYADRFEGPNALYRKGLRTSTCPENRDPSSFPKLPGAAAPAPGISKASSRAAKGAALRASLKATIEGAKLGALAEVSETDVSLNMTATQ